MGIFIILSVILFYANYAIHVTVNILGGVAFLLFCFILIFHLHNALMSFVIYSNFTEPLIVKFKNMQIMKKRWNPLYSVNTSHNQDIGNVDNYAYLQESLLEEQVN